MTSVTNIKHPNTNEEILRDLCGRSNNQEQQEWTEQGCVRLSQGLLAACLTFGVGFGLAYTEILDQPAAVTSALLKEVI